jgi:hypothetical protein
MGDRDFIFARSRQQPCVRMGRLKGSSGCGLTAATMRSHHTLPLPREIRELRLAAHIDGGMTMSVRSSVAAFVATLVLAVCGPLHTGPDGQLLPSTAHAQSKPRTSQGQPAQKSPAEQLRSQVDTLIARLRGRTSRTELSNRTAASRRRRSTSRPNTPAGWRR